jgi:hypothetical protein
MNRVHKAIAAAVVVLLPNAAYADWVVDKSPSGAYVAETANGMLNLASPSGRGGAISPRRS